MPIDYFGNTQLDVDFEDLREEFDGKLDNLRGELDGKLSEIPDPMGGKLVMSTSDGKIREACLYQKQFRELKGEELMGRNDCPIFSTPLKVESNMTIRKIIVHIHLKKGQQDKTKHLVSKLRPPPPYWFMMQTNLTLEAGETYKFFKGNYSLRRSILSLKWMERLMLLQFMGKIAKKSLSTNLNFLK